ncbi:hypothetical protein GGH96_005393 [Coemansia sp. RSA 1972]|nr:hypothetical protein GGH96_005393 [Coemansia sp. RSA 1972]
MKFSIVAAIAAVCRIAHGLEINLEWDIGEGTSDVSSASSLLRFTSDTAPELTEWVPLGWDHGSLGLQRRNNSESFIVMQLTPPTSRYQAILGKTSDISTPASHATPQGPSQVMLEARVELTPSAPYYFKVDAHHDIRRNRTTYEGLYSTGDKWMYLGSLILQHPVGNDTVHAAQSAGDELARVLSAMATSSPPAATSSAAKDSDDDSDDSDSDDEKDRGKQMFEVEDSFEDFVRDGYQELRAQAREPETAVPPASTAAHKINRAAATSTDSDSDSDSDSDIESDAPKSKKSTKSKASDASNDDASDASSAEQQARVKNPITFPEIPPFPRMYSGIRRLDGGSHTDLRAGVYKSFELRSRLGETFYVGRAHAFLYDSQNGDLAAVRHYFLASSYLLTIDGPKEVEDIIETETVVVAAESDLPQSDSPQSDSPQSD